MVAGDWAVVKLFRNFGLSVHITLLTQVEQSAIITCMNDRKTITGFKASDYEHELIEKLMEKLGCNKSDVLRYSLHVFATIHHFNPDYNILEDLLKKEN